MKRPDAAKASVLLACPNAVEPDHGGILSYDLVWTELRYGFRFRCTYCRLAFTMTDFQLSALIARRARPSAAVDRMMRS